MLLIQASNIHSGGGATLLRPLLQVPFAPERRVWVDARFHVPEQVAEGVAIKRVPRSMLARLKADAEVARQASAGDILLCLGNLPPIRRPRCRTVVYLQNRYLIGAAQLAGVSLAERSRLMAERLWLRSLVSHAQIYLVQTPSMQHAVCEHLKLSKEQVRIAPYLPVNANWQRSLDSCQSSLGHDERPFLYVASGEHHKNHHTLVQAWVQLASDGLYPALQLTLDQGSFPLITHWIEDQARQHHLKITVNTAPDRSSVDSLYRAARALVYPSRFESFGLPLIEARQAGLPVLAPELDYVRDVLDPDEVFDATSPRSIARAVKRFMGLTEPNLPSMNAEQFLQVLCEEC